MGKKNFLLGMFHFYLYFSIVINFKVSQALIVNSLITYNQELRHFNHIGAELAWQMSTNMENLTELLAANEEFILKKNLWNNDWCIKLLNEQLEMNLSDQRQVYLICRGPRFSSYQLSNVLSILATMRKTYDTRKVCLIDGKCYRMEPDLNNFMERTKDAKLLANAWTEWHHVIGKELSDPYIQLVKLMNLGARQAGHNDIGSCWREEMETRDLKGEVIDLYSKVKNLFSLLHGFVRFKLEKYYNINLKYEAIPAHLLGNMWSQRWDSLINIIWPIDDEEQIPNQFIRHHIGLNSNVDDMVNFANKFYENMGFPSLPPKFYTNSYFEFDNSSSKNCHGSAANMFGNQDYRVMMCASPTDSDLQTLIHEIGHIHYFMAYENLPTVFQDGANAAFQEAVGDAVTYGMHPNLNLRSLLKIGLFKIPQIAFGLVVDLWRWEIFEIQDGSARWNDLWWELNHKYLGIRVPDGYKSQGLDALGKYHIVDNIPYIRYFHGSFLQHMFYKAMCNGEVYCSLEGRSRSFRRMLSRGSSTHWSKILYEFTGYNRVTPNSLLEYYKPLQVYLENQIILHQIPIGW